MFLLGYVHTLTHKGLQGTKVIKRNCNSISIVFLFIGDLYECDCRFSLAQSQEINYKAFLSLGSIGHANSWREYFVFKLPYLSIRLYENAHACAWYRHGIYLTYTGFHFAGKEFPLYPQKKVDGTSRVVRVCQLPQLQQWLARVLVGFFHSSFCGLWFWFWFCLLSGHDCVPASSSAPSPPSTGKNAINFRPCFYFCFFFGFRFCYLSISFKRFLQTFIYVYFFRIRKLQFRLPLLFSQFSFSALEPHRRDRYFFSTYFLKGVYQLPTSWGLPELLSLPLQSLVASLPQCEAVWIYEIMFEVEVKKYPVARVVIV